MKSGNLNFLEPSGPLQACNGTAKKKNLYYCNFFTPIFFRFPENCTFVSCSIFILKAIHLCYVYIFLYITSKPLWSQSQYSCFNLSFLSCRQPHYDHVWSKHVVDLLTKHVVIWLDLFCLFNQASGFFLHIFYYHKPLLQTPQAVIKCVHENLINYLQTIDT